MKRIDAWTIMKVYALCLVILAVVYVLSVILRK